MSVESKPLILVTKAKILMWLGISWLVIVNILYYRQHLPTAAIVFKRLIEAVK